MNMPLLSNAWYRVAALKPRLRSHARLHRHRYRDEVWYLLQDPVSNRVHRFTPAARLVIAAMDGKRTVENLWELANKRLGEEAPTQDEIINLLGQLHAADLLQSDVTPDVGELFDRGEREQKALRRRTYMNPMAVRIPLWDPDASLNRFSGFIGMLWSRWGALLWLAVVLPALILLPPHWQELTGNFSDRVLAADNLLLLWLVFPVIKVLHELGHASATKAGGGEVHDMGLILLVLMPVPYVEASAATAFKSKYQRAGVAAAGMIVELFIAALAFYLWLLIEPGTMRAILFNVMLIAGVSTLAFNGNPLLRFDAYYILADLIEIPNLAKRSLHYWEYLVKRYVFGATDVEQPHATRGEKAWFMFYGPVSTIYRVMITFAIALFIAGEFFVIGVILAIWAVVAMAVVPVVKGILHLLESPTLRVQRRRAIAITVGAISALFVFLFVVPMPFRSNAEGVIWFSDESIVRAATNSFVGELMVAPGTRVSKGDALFKCHDPVLETQVRLGEARVAELEASYSAEFVTDRAKANVVREQMESEKAALARIREQAGGLVVRAGTGGVFIAPQADNMPGRYYRKGDLLGYVVEKGHPIARVVVEQDAVDMVRLATDRVIVRHVHRADTVTEGRIVRQAPAGVEYLPSRALSTEGGGQISTDPRDQQGVKTLQRMFQFDIELTDNADAAFFGERVYVRFSHEMEPLALQWYRSIRLLFLSRFSI
jgi:putative peptide zinc metalloprotease protein